MTSAGDPGPTTVTTPWYRSWTGGTVLLGLVTALPGFIPQIAELVPPQWVPYLKGIAILCALVSSATAHGGATQNGAKLRLSPPEEAMKVLKQLGKG